MLVFKELIDCLLLLMYMVIMLLMKIHIENIFFPDMKQKNYNIEIDGRNFYDQSINDLIKQYDALRKILIEQGDDYTTGCLLSFAYFKKKLQINCWWFKQTKSFKCIS